MAGTSTLTSEGWQANGAPPNDFQFKGIGFFIGQPSDEVGVDGDLSVDPVSLDVYKKTAGAWAAQISGPSSITLSNSSGSLTRTLNLVAGVATLAATDTLVGNGDTVSIVNSAGGTPHDSTATVVGGVITHSSLAATTAIVDQGEATIVESSIGGGLAGGESTLIVAAGVFQGPRLNVATVTLLNDGAQIHVHGADGVTTQDATLTVAGGVAGAALLPANVGLVVNGLSVILHKNDGTVSAGNAGLNSPGVAEVSGGKLQDVKAGA